jgi:hypothetical protein
MVPNVHNPRASSDSYATQATQVSLGAVTQIFRFRVAEIFELRDFRSMVDPG